MPRFAANLDLLFTEYPLRERFKAARKAGFTHVEMLFPYVLSPSDLRVLLDDNGLSLILINTPAGNWQAGGRGFGAVPDRADEFRRGVDQALQYAEALDTPLIHLLAGVARPEQLHDTFVENLDWATRLAPDQPFTLEPINPYDMPGYALHDFDTALRLLDMVNTPNLHLQFDAYHAHRITEDAIKAWGKYGHRAAHVQIAGAPGRNEPVGGEIDYPCFFDTLNRDHYTGFASAEYHPANGTENGLGWLRAYSSW